MRVRMGTREHALNLDLRRSFSPIEQPRLLWTPRPEFSKHQKHVNFHIPRPILELNG